LDSKDFLLDVWAHDSNGKRVHPYKGERGAKRGYFSVNFTNDTNNYQPMTKAQLVDAILAGRFNRRGTIRMLPIDAKPGDERNAFAPTHYKGKPVKDFPMGT